MANMTRRTAIGASAGAAGLVGLARAAEPNSNVRTMAMDRHIERYEQTAGIEFPGWDPTTSALIAEVEMTEDIAG